MRLIYILLLLIVVNSQYSEKDCQEVLMYFNYGMKINEVLNMLSEDGTFVIDKIPSILDNSYTQIGTVAGKLLYKKYLKNYVVECHQFYWNEYQKKTEAEQAKKMKLEAEEEERRAERKSHNARADKIQSIIGWVLFIIVMGLVLAFVCFCIYCLYEDLSKNYIFFERRIKK